MELRREEAAGEPRNGMLHNVRRDAGCGRRIEDEHVLLAGSMVTESFVDHNWLDSISNATANITAPAAATESDDQVDRCLASLQLNRQGRQRTPNADRL
jgi:hypothetical protein